MLGESLHLKSNYEVVTRKVAEQDTAFRKLLFSHTRPEGGNYTFVDGAPEPFRPADGPGLATPSRRRLWRAEQALSETGTIETQAEFGGIFAKGDVDVVKNFDVVTEKPMD